MNNKHIYKIRTSVDKTSCNFLEINDKLKNILKKYKIK